MATWVLLTAANAACGDGGATRAESPRERSPARLPSIPGSDPSRYADLIGARVYVFKVTNGKYTLAG